MRNMIRRSCRNWAWKRAVIGQFLGWICWMQLSERSGVTRERVVPCTARLEATARWDRAVVLDDAEEIAGSR